MRTATKQTEVELTLIMPLYAPDAPEYIFTQKPAAKDLAKVISGLKKLITAAEGVTLTDIRAEKEILFPSVYAAVTGTAADLEKLPGLLGKNPVITADGKMGAGLFVLSEAEFTEYCRGEQEYLCFSVLHKDGDQEQQIKEKYYGFSSAGSEKAMPDVDTANGAIKFFMDTVVSDDIDKGVGTDTADGIPCVHLYRWYNPVVSSSAQQYAGVCSTEVEVVNASMDKHTDAFRFDSRPLVPWICTHRARVPE